MRKSSSRWWATGIVTGTRNLSQSQVLRWLKLPVILEWGFVIFLCVVAIAANTRMIKDGVSGLGDIRWHLTWLQHFSKQFSEGIVYPRWLAGTNFGFGSPTFVFYPPLVFYLGTGLRLLGIGFEATVSALFTLGLFLSGLSFYFCGRERWGRFPAFAGSLAYILNPGILGLIQSGGLAPLYSYVWLPLLVYLTDSAKIKPRALVQLSVVWTLVALTHLPSLLIYAVAWGIYCVIRLWGSAIRVWLQLASTAMVGWGMAAFFLVPVVLEQRYINIDYMLASQGGFQSKMFELGAVLQTGLGDVFIRQWLFCGVVGAIAFAGFAQSSYWKRQVKVISFAAISIIFLILNISWPIWRLLPTLQKIEYSGRLDRLLYLAFAVLVALAAKSVAAHSWRYKRFTQALALTTVGGILMMNFVYHHQHVRQSPGLYSAGNGVMHNREWIERIVETPYSDRLIDVPEYRPQLPKSAATQETTGYEKEVLTDDGFPKTSELVVGRLPTPQPQQPQIEILRGSGEVNDLDWQSYERGWTMRLSDLSQVRVRTYAYPGWQLSVNNTRVDWTKGEDGRIEFELPAGQYVVQLRYVKTAAFSLGLFLSAGSLGLLLWLGYDGWPRYGKFAVEGALPPRLSE